MKINLLPQNERIENRCFICGGYPVKYRTNMKWWGITYYNVKICNRCALMRADILEEGKI